MRHYITFLPLTNEKQVLKCFTFIISSFHRCRYRHGHGINGYTSPTVRRRKSFRIEFQHTHTDASIRNLFSILIKFYAPCVKVLSIDFYMSYYAEQGKQRAHNTTRVLLTLPLQKKKNP